MQQNRNAFFVVIDSFFGSVCILVRCDSSWKFCCSRSRTIRNYGDARGTSGYTGSSPSTSHRSAIRKGLDSYD